MVRARKTEDIETDQAVAFSGDVAALHPAAPPAHDLDVNPGVMAALDEISAEAEQAKQAMALLKSGHEADSIAVQAPSTEKEEKPEPSPEQTAEERRILILRLKERAKRQGEIGLRQLTTAPNRRGDMEFVREVQVNDVPIANMVQRYVSIADRLLARLHGFGAVILGEEKAVTSIEILTGYINEIYRDARTLHEQIKVTSDTHKKKRESEGEEWIQPQYARAALGVQVHLMRREGNKLLEAFLLYDKSIELLHVLEWNDGTDPDEVLEIVKRARRLGGKIFRSALAGQIELGRRLQRKESKSSAPQESEQSVAS